MQTVVGQAVALASVGIAIGIGSALALNSIMQRMLFGVTATDPMTFVSVALLLGTVALMACYIPARRATKVDPLVALRYE